VFILLAGFSACKKETEILPGETQSGAGTFGAKINGENWGPLKAGILPTAPILEASFAGNNSFKITARNFSRTPIETEMQIYLQNITAPGTYPLTQNTDPFPYQTGSYAYYVKRNLNIEDEWITSSAATGEVVVTRLDIPNHVISGTFQFTANARYGSAPITVTEGRFDVKIQ
ncbi:MAG TPA: DUF6252 family protein, partial [Flavisolibacter sp.]|nr:DUF6252 family protein [Flavisolibacter sp.]